jgi:hypothetical protein
MSKNHELDLNERDQDFDKHIENESKLNLSDKDTKEKIINIKRQRDELQNPSNFLELLVDDYVKLKFVINGISDSKNFILIKTPSTNIDSSIKRFKETFTDLHFKKLYDILRSEISTDTIKTYFNSEFLKEILISKKEPESLNESGLIQAFLRELLTSDNIIINIDARIELFTYLCYPKQEYADVIIGVFENGKFIIKVVVLEDEGDELKNINRGIEVALAMMQRGYVKDRFLYILIVNYLNFRFMRIDVPKGDIKNLNRYQETVEVFIFPANDSLDLTKEQSRNTILDIIGSIIDKLDIK